MTNEERQLMGLSIGMLGVVVGLGHPAKYSQLDADDRTMQGVYINRLYTLMSCRHEVMIS